MPLRVTALTATEILDSRSRPTLLVSLEDEAGRKVTAGVPSGASTGSREAVERRDGDVDRYGGLGVQRTVMAVEGEIAERLSGEEWRDLESVDRALITLDGTDDKGRLGANAIVGVSMAFARAFALGAGIPLYRSLERGSVASRLPVPHFNVVNGGAHAQNGLAFQEFLLAPLGAPNVREAVRAGAEVYAALKARLHADGMSTGLGDEGGFAPAISEPEQVLDLLVDAIGEAGYAAGRDGVAIALDPAASEFRRDDGLYEVGGSALSSGEMIERYAAIVDRYPVWSIEDGLAEDDQEGWVALTERLGDGVQLVGDDNFVTNPAIIRDAVEAGIGNAALIKLNQVGTVTETLEAIDVCRGAGYAQMISHRSGETTDDFISDLAVGTGCGQLKSGAPARGERVAKYNRLIVLEREERLSYGLPGRP